MLAGSFFLQATFVLTKKTNYISVISASVKSGDLRKTAMQTFRGVTTYNSGAFRFFRRRAANLRFKR